LRFTFAWKSSIMFVCKRTLRSRSSKLICPMSRYLCESVGASASQSGNTGAPAFRLIFRFPRSIARGLKSRASAPVSRSFVALNRKGTVVTQSHTRGGRVALFCD